MQVFTEVLGNIHKPEWENKLEGMEVVSIFLDQWTAQKSRFLGKGDDGVEYPVALARHSQIADGDVIYFNPEEKRAIVLRLALSPVLVIDMSKLSSKTPEDIIRISVELGHAIGNQHWPAVVKGTTVYVPLTVDKKVMMSVLETHHIEDIVFEFKDGTSVIPYLAPHEMRRLFGGAGQESHSHEHIHGHDHTHAHIHEHTHEHTHADGTVHSHEHHHHDHDHSDHNHDHEHPHHHH
ncbi:MAG: urease accessory protein UreE [Bacteroidales bacterium]|nr:urease accessory protein UreE [Bacteroidales bacterium]